ncbi:MAG: hypothetical protein O7D86_14960 [Proteobacteria bacterium]|nr:hypothetical protein [Pseudomonadota bacterium]
MSSPAMAIDFRQAANRPSKAKTAAPFSIRFTEEERTLLQEKAGGRSLGAYIREQRLGEQDDIQTFRTARIPRNSDKQPPVCTHRRPAAFAQKTQFRA